MDTSPGVNSTHLPPQWPGTSFSSNIVVCTRCGRATEQCNAQNICDPCATGGLRPSAVISVGPSTMERCRTVKCTACRVPFKVVSLRQSAQVLCPPCQALRSAIVRRDTRDCGVPRVSPYPVIPPMAQTPRALALALAFTYPYLPAPLPPSVSAGGRACTSVNCREDVVRACMRFGCGAQLPPHVIGDLCEACARVGFVRQPPAVVQKHAPRCATERMRPRSRESLDLARVSMLQETPHDAEVTTKEKNAENESEAELMYPDEDIPVTTQHVSKTPESKRDDSRPLEDDDLELELVYPGDAATATRTTSSTPKTKLFPPTTLRELFTEGLCVIPNLRNPTALAGRSAPRHCRIPGCREVLPSQTCMQRCIKCSLGDWKRRKLAAKDTLDPLRPSTSSLTTDTTMEEKEVANMVDETLDVDDGSNFPPPPYSPSSNELMDENPVGSIPGWESDLTELSCSNSDAESMPNSDPGPDRRLGSPQEGVMSLRIRVPLLFTRLPPGSPLRKCGNKKCNITLPKNHRRKTCDPCRRAQRIKFENKRRNMVTIEMLKSLGPSCRQWHSPGLDMRTVDVTLTTKTSRPCSGGQCRKRIPLPELYRWKTCTSCRASARRDAQWKRDAYLATQQALCQPEIMPRFPAYQNRGKLLSSFDAQLRGFIEGQIMHFHAKLHDSESGSQAMSGPWKPQHTPMVFTFVGEYSIVIGQRGAKERNSQGHNHSGRLNKPGELEAMRREVSSIVLDLQCILRAKFRAGEAFAIDKGGIIMRFTCPLELVTQLHPLANTVGPAPVSPSGSDPEATASKGEDAPSTVKPAPRLLTAPLVRRFSAELEVVVVPDESHHLFHGRRTVARYRMVG